MCILYNDIVKISKKEVNISMSFGGLILTLKTPLWHINISFFLCIERIIMEISLRPYQENLKAKARKAFLNYKRVILLAPCGGRKDCHC